MLSRPFHRALLRASPRPKTVLARSLCASPRVKDKVRRSSHQPYDERNRLTAFWAPTGGMTPKADNADDSTALLVRAGFIRQAHAGIFHFLPLGLRVQEKLERLVDKHMRGIGASKVSLSSISSEKLWRRTGRMDGDTKELLRIKDRKDSGLLLGPTHEEEVTSLVASIVQSWKQLPLRLYQISRKYRDEKRPRQGLLRAKEFLMKDLYTFDSTESAALITYEEVQRAYEGIFHSLKLPFIKASADSGAIGGDLSHEWHFVSDNGEDNVGLCRACNYSANENVLAKKLVPPGPGTKVVNFYGISRDRQTLVEISVPVPDSVQDNNQAEIAALMNFHAVKKICPELDTSLIGSDVLKLWEDSLKSENADDFRVMRLKDHRVAQETARDVYTSESTQKITILPAMCSHPVDGTPLDLSITKSGDPCPKCSEPLEIVRAVEVGHTFHLGTRYSAPLKAQIHDQQGPKIIEMGCHGIGVSRMIGAVAALSADSKGLNWPRAIAPFSVVIVGQSDGGSDEDMHAVYDRFEARGWDSIIDDRKTSVGWKMKDADLIGYNVIVAFRSKWATGEGLVEVQCRRLGEARDVPIAALEDVVGGLLDQL